VSKPETKGIRMDEVKDTMIMFTRIVDALNRDANKSLLAEFPDHGLDEAGFKRFANLHLLKNAVLCFKGINGAQHRRVSEAIAGIVVLDLSKPCLTTFECDFREAMEKDLKDIQAMMAHEPRRLRCIIDNGLKLRVVSTESLTMAQGTALLDQLERGASRIKNAIYGLECETEALDAIAALRWKLSRC